MMKKIIALMLAVLMLFALVACDDKKDKDTKGTAETVTEEKTEDKKTEDEKTVEKTEDKKTVEKTEEKKTEDKKTEDKKTEDKKTDDKDKDDKKPVSNSKAVKEYVEENKETLVSGINEGFASTSSMTCTSDVVAEGNGIIIYIYIDDVSNVDDATKAQMQKTYDDMASIYEALLATMQKELPELESLEYVICDETGDVLASIHAGK